MNSLKETFRFHLEITFRALSSFRKVGGYGAKRLWRLEDAEPEFPIPEDGGWRQRFQTPRTETQGNGVPEPWRTEDVEPEFPIPEDGGWSQQFQTPRTETQGNGVPSPGGPRM